MEFDVFVESVASMLGSRSGSRRFRGIAVGALTAAGAIVLLAVGVLPGVLALLGRGSTASPSRSDRRPPVMRVMGRWNWWLPRPPRPRAAAAGVAIGVEVTTC
jgi:hypothetical protein